MAVKKITNPTIDFLLEEDFMSYLLENPNQIVDANKIITPSAFTDPLMEASFKACIELYSDGKVFNRYDVFRVLKLKEKELGVDSSKVLTLLPKRSIDILQISSELKELENKRFASELSVSIQQALVDGDDSATISTIIEKGLESMTENISSSEIYSIDALYDSVLDRMQATAGITKFSGIDTGSRKLNYALGGWQEGMTIIAARPGMGKTIVGLEHAKCAGMSGKSVLFLSLEMPKESLMYRYISSEAHEFKYSDLKANRITQEDVSKIRNSNARMLKQLPIFFYDSDNRDVNYLSSILKAEVRKNKIDMVVIDYLQLIRDNQMKDQSDFAQVSSVSNKVQKLSRSLSIPIIGLSQLSRSIEGRTNRTPMLSDLRSSGNIEQDAIVVIGLYRDDYYKYNDAKTNGQAVAPMDNTLKYTILKNRDGEVGDIVRYVDVRTNRVADTEEELFRFDKPEVLFHNSALNNMSNDFDQTTLSPF
jgi:replicative DNA helicase